MAKDMEERNDWDQEKNKEMGKRNKRKLQNTGKGDTIYV